MVSITKPVLKWVGGKTQIMDDVLACFPPQINNYYEPFLGGGSVLLGVLSYAKAGKIQIQGKVHAFDINPNIIWLFSNLQSNVDELIVKVKNICAEFATCRDMDTNRNPSSLSEALTSKESYYYWVRKRYNALARQERSSTESSAMLIFLNKTCFRGLYREGPNGFNVPYGNYTKPTIIEECHLRKVSELIQGVEFECCSFQSSLAKPSKGDFVYLDPPYVPESSSSFVTYTTHGFNTNESVLLFKLCNELASQDIGLLLSNANVEIVKNTFPPPVFVTKVLTCRRAINAKKPGSATTEVLITNVNNTCNDL